MKGFCPLASSSQGNCIYLGTSETKVLVDCGISGKRVKEELAAIEVDISEIDAILVTHEHGDHIRGLRVLAYRLGIPVIANAETAKGIIDVFGESPKLKIFSTGETFEYRDLVVHPFTVQHDALDPVGFTIHTEERKIGFCTDLGFATSLVRAQLEQCDYLYLEANHEPDMVHASGRPPVYTQRVLGRSGHLSNADCGKLLNAVTHPGLKHVHLAHLSGECNSPAKALDVVGRALASEGHHIPLSVAQPRGISRPIPFSTETDDQLFREREENARLVFRPAITP